jgi:hypothetical protein
MTQTLGGVSISSQAPDPVLCSGRCLPLSHLGKHSLAILRQSVDASKPAGQRVDNEWIQGQAEGKRPCNQPNVTNAGGEGGRPEREGRHLAPETARLSRLQETGRCGGCPGQMSGETSDGQKLEESTIQSLGWEA